MKNAWKLEAMKAFALLGAATLTGGCLVGIGFGASTNVSAPATTTAAPATSTAAPAPAPATPAASMTDKGGDGGKGQNSSYGY